MKALRRRFWRYLAKRKKEKSGLPRPLEEFSPERVRRVLVVSCTALGDSLLSTPAIRATRKLFPEAEIFWLIKPAYLPLFRSNPHVDGFLPYRGGLKGLRGLVASLRGFDLFLSFHDSDEGPVLAAVLAGVPFILRTGLRDEGVRAFLSARVPYRDEVHAVEQRLDVLRVLMGEPSLEFDPRLELPVTAEAREFSARLLQGRPRIGFQCLGSNPYCAWPLDRFRALAEALRGLYPQGRIYLLGAKKDERTLSYLADGRFVLNLAGKIPIAYLGGVVAGLDLLVTIDTGPMHVAFAVGTPTVCLFVPSEVRHTGPYQDLERHRVIRKERPCKPCRRKYCEKPWCMELISVEEVISACREALSC